MVQGSGAGAEASGVGGGMVGAVRWDLSDGGGDGGVAGDDYEGESGAGRRV